MSFLLTMAVGCLAAQQWLAGHRGRGAALAAAAVVLALLTGQN